MLLQGYLVRIKHSHVEIASEHYINVLGVLHSRGVVTMARVVGC